VREIGFYYIDESINVFLYNFLSQLVYRNGRKVLLYSTSGEKLKSLDRMLWEICGEAGFLCHSVYDAKNVEARYEKILLSGELVNSNGADYLLLSSFVDRRDFLDSFDKGFYLCANSSQESLERARESQRRYHNLGYSVVLQRREGGSQWRRIDYPGPDGLEEK
jgi:DNA polymerase IIIc chi subunit